MRSGERAVLDGMTVLEAPERVEKGTSANNFDEKARQSKPTGAGVVFQLVATVCAVGALVITLRSYSSTRQHPEFIWLFIVCSASFYIVLHNALSVEEAIRLWLYRQHPALHRFSIVIAVILAALPFAALHVMRLDSANAAPSVQASMPSSSGGPKALPPENSLGRATEPALPAFVLSAVQYQSGLSTTTVTIGVDENVQYEIKRLTNPDRIYLDFRGSKIEGALLRQSFAVTDPLLRAIRIAEHKGNVSRVTLETNGFCDYLLTTVAKSHKLQIQLLSSAAGHSTSPSILSSPKPASDSDSTLTSLGSSK